MPQLEDMTFICFVFLQVPMALTGDALFTLGCGRVFTGDFVRMQADFKEKSSGRGAWSETHMAERETVGRGPPLPNRKLHAKIGPLKD